MMKKTAGSSVRRTFIQFWKVNVIQLWMGLITGTFIQFWMINVVRLWMVLITVNIHPILDGQCHPTVDGLNKWNVHPILDGQCRPIMDGFNNC